MEPPRSRPTLGRFGRPLDALGIVFYFIAPKSRMHFRFFLSFVAATAETL